MAFVIAALALSALYQGVIVGLRSARVAAHTEAALSRVESRLAAFSDPALLVPGHAGGNDGGGFSWQTDVVQAASGPMAGVDAPTSGRAPQAVLYRVSVTVSWTMDGGARSVSLASARLGSMGAAPP